MGMKDFYSLELLATANEPMILPPGHRFHIPGEERFYNNTGGMNMEQTYTGGVECRKTKTHFARITVSKGPDFHSEPYFEIMYYDPERKDFAIGYGSYDLGMVQGWMKQYFKVEGINAPLAFSSGMTFGDAIQAAKLGHRIARAGWNGKGQYVELGTTLEYCTTGGVVVAAVHQDIGSKALVFCGTRGRQVGWLASQADMLADDWRIVE